MIRTSTVVYIILLLALVGAYFYLKDRNAATAEIEVTVEPGSGSQVAPAYLFTADEGTPSSIRIESKAGAVVEVERNAENVWMLKQPTEAEADPAAAEAAASQLTSMRIVDTVPDVEPKIVGLEDPEYILTVKFAEAGQRTVDIGVVTPTESGYYARNKEGDIVIVSRDAIDPLLGLLENPPYLETLTPEANTPVVETATP